MGTQARQAFPIVSLEVGDDRQRKPHIVATCRFCNTVGEIPVSKHSGGLPSEAGAKMFRKRGWRMGATRAKDECPACGDEAHIMSAPEGDRPILTAISAVKELKRGILQPPAEPEEIPVVSLKRERKPRHERPKPEAPRLPDPKNMPTAIGAAMVEAALDKATKEGIAIPTSELPAKGKGLRAYWARMTPEERSDELRRRNATRAMKKLTDQPKEPQMTKPDLKVVAQPEAPRQPTRDDNRRIRDALDEHYNEDKQCYRGSMRDKTLAEKLNVPAAWVTGVRDSFFGPDKSEMDDKVSQEIAACWADLRAAETKMLTALEDMDKVRKRLTQTCERAGLPVPT